MPHPEEVARARATRELLRPYLSEARRQRIREVLDTRTRDVTVLLEDLVSDHNGAAVLRTSDAMGLMEAHLVPLPTGFKVSRKVAQGSQKWMEIERHDSTPQAYAALRSRGFEIWASAVHGDAVSVDEVPKDRRVAFVFGNEHSGLSSFAVDEADGRFRLPMYGFVESLNISVATALTLAQAVEPRRRAGTLTPLSPDDRDVVEARWYFRSVRAAAQLLTQAGVPVDDAAAPIDMVEGRENDAR